MKTRNLLAFIAPFLAVPVGLHGGEPGSFAVPSSGIGAMCVCAIEFPDMLPPEYLAYMKQVHAHHEEAAPKTDKQFTLLPVDIDPLGADPDSPWYIHINSLNVRNQPNVQQSSVIGSLSRNTLVSGVYNIVAETDEEWLEFDFNGQTGHISRLGFSRIHSTNQDMIDSYTNLPYGREIVNRWWGIPLEYEADDLVHIPNPYNNQVSGRVYQLRQEAAESVMALIDLARSEGVVFYVASPYRSGPTQQTIFVNNMNNNLAQRSSAPPGHSEHQLATTVDFSNGTPGRFLRNTDSQYHWLVENAPAFGWRQSYTADNVDETGYIEEPWHWRYHGEPASADGWMIR
ncbi:MAG: M15 family metallopeptidase [Candidatus Sumerlaeia bacterium]|nr:M15 family metallopeptidase [Candidatus Sumerlaeia bacterium]